MHVSTDMYLPWGFVGAGSGAGSWTEWLLVRLAGGAGALEHRSWGDDLEGGQEHRIGGGLVCSFKSLGPIRPQNVVF